MLDSNIYMRAVNPALYTNTSGSFTDIHKEYCDVKKCTNRCEKAINNIEKIQRDYYDGGSKTQSKKELRSLLDVVPMFRRIERVPDKMEKNDGVSAMGLVSLALLNLPADIHDTVEAVKGRKPAYDHKMGQKPFSFFRYTLLEKFADRDKSPFPKLAERLWKKDSTLYDSPLGRLVNRVFKLDTNVSAESSAVMFSKKAPLIGELAARALLRTTKIGAVAHLALVEAPHFVKEIKSGKDVKKELKESAISYTSNLALIGGFGAAGFKYFKYPGSLIGMGIGAMAANKLSSHFDT